MMECRHCAKEMEGSTVFVDRKTGAGYCSPVCRKAGPTGCVGPTNSSAPGPLGEPGAVGPTGHDEASDWFGRPLVPGCTICGHEVTAIDQICAVHERRGQPRLFPLLDGSGLQGFPYLAEVATLGAIVQEGEKRISALTVLRDLASDAANDLLAQRNQAQDARQLAEGEIQRLAADLQSEKAENEALDACLTELSAELDAQRARFSTTVCGLREDLQLAFKIHADVENQTTEALERVVQDRNRLGIEWEQARDMLRQELDAAKQELRQETGSRSYWQAEAGGLKRSLEASKRDGREVATAYFRLRRLCYLTAFFAPLAGAAALAATLYRYTLLPYLTTHAPSSGTWCLLAVGLACLLVGRRWRGAVVVAPVAPAAIDLACCIHDDGRMGCDVCGWRLCKQDVPPRNRKCFYCEEPATTWHGRPNYVSGPEGYVPWCGFGCEGIEP